MKLIKVIQTLAITSLVLTTSISTVFAKDKFVRPIGGIKPPIVYPQPVLKKSYKVPGSVAIGTAKRHGYHFGVAMKDIPRGCKFQGLHWLP